MEKGVSGKAWRPFRHTCWRPQTTKDWHLDVCCLAFYFRSPYRFVYRQLLSVTRNNYLAKI